MSTNGQLNRKTNDLANKSIKDGDLAKSERAPLTPRLYFVTIFRQKFCQTLLKA